MGVFKGILKEALISYGENQSPSGARQPRSTGRCEHCNDSGEKRCSVCNGKGNARDRETGWGRCTECGGRGYVPCDACQKGAARSERAEAADARVRHQQETSDFNATYWADEDEKKRENADAQARFLAEIDAAEKQRREDNEMQDAARAAREADKERRDAETDAVIAARDETTKRERAEVQTRQDEAHNAAAKQRREDNEMQDAARAAREADQQRRNAETDAVLAARDETKKRERAEAQARFLAEIDAAEHVLQDADAADGFPSRSTDTPAGRYPAAHAATVEAEAVRRVPLADETRSREQSCAMLDLCADRRLRLLVLALRDLATSCALLARVRTYDELVRQPLLLPDDLKAYASSPDARSWLGAARAAATLANSLVN